MVGGGGKVIFNSKIILSPIIKLPSKKQIFGKDMLINMLINIDKF